MSKLSKLLEDEDFLGECAAGVVDALFEADARIAALEAAVKPLMEIYDYDVDPDRLMEWCDNIRAVLEKTPEGWSHKNDGWR